MTTYLTIGDDYEVTVPVVIGSAKYREQSVPSEAVRLAFSGVPRSSMRGYVRIWEGIETQWLTANQEDEILEALKDTPPLTVAGRMAGSISALAANIRRVDEGMLIVDGVATDVARLAFDLWEVPA